MISIVCNSGISFFNHYISTFREFNYIKIEKFYINENLISDFKKEKLFITSKVLKSLNFKDLINIRAHFKFYKSINCSESKTFHFISVHPLNVIQILILKAFDKQIISTIHDLKPHPDWKSKLVNLIQKFIIFLSDEIILHNRKDNSFVQKSYYIPLSGYNLNIQKKIFNKNLLFFGRIEDYKGLGNIKL